MNKYGNRKVTIKVAALLDLLSTSQKNGADYAPFLSEISDNLRFDIEFELEQSRAIQAPRCEKYAPFIFFIDHTGQGRLVQGCCNDWTCKRCGQIRAREEYGRIVEGARKLSEAGHKLYFWTLTCRGRECSVEEAESNYLRWTNHLLSSCRYQAKKVAVDFVYVQVTERQKRQHPHSHLIASFVPPDAQRYLRGEKLPNARVAKHDCLWSEWFREANIKSGLGKECDLSAIESPVAVAVYISKYLFKEAMSTKWPKGWKRIRYSQNWPKLPERTPDLAFPLIRLADWKRLGALDMSVIAEDRYCYEAALERLVTNVIPPRKLDNDTKYHYAQGIATHV